MSESAAWTIQRILDWSIGFLKERGSPSARLDTELLLAHALGCTRIQLYTGFDKPLRAEEREPFKKLLLRRANGEPVAYITETKEFMGLPLRVTRDVLIPRPDTEVLVEQALPHVLSKRAADQPSGDEEVASVAILDVGTGSGCIALALAKQLPAARVIAWDVSVAALAVAEQNRAALALDNVQLERRDALSSEAWASVVPESFDLIVSNPPYIATSEASDLPVSVIGYEPRTALIADDGLPFYRAFAVHAARALKPQGRLLVEIGSSQGAAVCALLQDAGWRDVEVVRDYNRLDRVISARRP